MCLELYPAWTADMTTLDKVRGLIAMASADGMALEEARAMALTAVRLIARDNLVISDPLDAEDGRRTPNDERNLQRSEREGRETLRRWPEAGPTPRARAVRRPDGSTNSAPPVDLVVTARAAGFCAICGDAFPKGERVVWRVATRDIAHLGCHASVRTADPDGL